MNTNEFLDGILSTIFLTVAYGGFAIGLLVSIAVIVLWVVATPLQIFWLFFIKFKNQQKYAFNNLFFYALTAFFVGFYLLSTWWLLYGKHESGPFKFLTLIAPLVVFEYLFWKSFSVIETKTHMANQEVK